MTDDMQPHHQIISIPAGVKSGEYLIHVFIEETRGLRHPKYDDQTVDPVIKVQVGTKYRISKPKESIGSGATYWGEHFFFEKNYATSHEVEREKIIISVLDHSSFGLNARIGNIELNASAIYQNPHHCIQYQWAALSGLTKRFREVLGFIKFSIGVFHNADEQVHFEDEKMVDAVTSFNAMNVLYPPQINLKTYQIRVRIFRGENLKKMDKLGKCDPYVKVEYGGQKISSTVQKVTLDPVWNQELLIPATLPTINDRLSLKLIDWDAPPQPNEPMGSYAFKIKDIQEGKYKYPLWINIYGPPRRASKKFEKIMTEVPEIATKWHGRLQVAVDMYEEQRPMLQHQAIKDGRIIKAAMITKREKYTLRAEVHYAMNLPSNGTKYFLKIKWGQTEAVTSKKEPHHKLVEYYESLVLNSEFPKGTFDELGMPDVLIYLNGSTKDYSYIRKPFNELMKIDAQPECFYFTIDDSVTSKREDLAGIVKMRIFITKTEDERPLHKYGWDLPLLKRSPKCSWRIQFNVFQARNLIAGDSTGDSDPYLKVNLYGNEQQTSVASNTLDPVWNEKLEFMCNFDTIEEAPPFVLTMWDKDSIGSDFLGSATVNLLSSDINPVGKPKPRWIPLKYGKSQEDFGKVLVSICCYSAMAPITSLNLEPEVRRYRLNMKIIGLRGLKSAGLLPIKQSAIKFNLGNLEGNKGYRLMHEKKCIQALSTDSGQDPNFQTVINVDLTLPIDPEYCPAISCGVYDQILSGLVKSMIGSFSIPLGDQIVKTKRRMEKRIDSVAKLNDPVILQRKLHKNSLDEFNEEETQAANTRDTLSNNTLNNLESNSLDICIDINKDDVSRKTRESKDYVLYPSFEANGYEINKPDPMKYMELGYDSKDKKLFKHYRYYINSELEKTHILDDSPFEEIPIFHGKAVSNENYLKALFGSKKDHKTVGTFKAMINIMSEEDHENYTSKLDLMGQDKELLEFSDEEFLRKKDVLVRVYVIEAEGLPDKDEDSNSDPYLVLKLGSTKYNESKNFIQDCPNPKFYKCYEFYTTFPGTSKLEIGVWDHDDFKKDDLIGTTTIDLENRWFSSSWRTLKHNPIETRKLYHPASKLPQGNIKLWVDIIPGNAKKHPIWNIAPKPPMEFELRTIVWECKNVPRVDIEEAVDIYINGRLDNGQQHRTDTHFRSTNGEGSFNWRMVYPVTVPMKKHRITFQIMDKDLLTKNDYISEATLDFENEALKAFNQEKSVTIMGNDLESNEKFWVKCSNTRVQKDGINLREELGSVLVSLQLIPKEEALNFPVGQGRSEPNQYPYLPPPSGRMQFTLNPFKMLNQMIGPSVRKKIYKYCFCCLCLLILVLIIPSLLASVIARPV